MDILVLKLPKMFKNGCPWNEYASAAAAKKGHLECLKYARENGCLWDLIKKDIDDFFADEDACSKPVSLG